MSVFEKGSVANRVLSVLLAMAIAIWGVNASAISQAWADNDDAQDEMTALVENSQGGEEITTMADDTVVDNVLFAKAEAAKDADDNPIVEALTGESLKVSYYAYNDNPNATALAQVRLFIDQTTLNANVTRLTEEGFDRASTEEQAFDLKISEGGVATEVKAVWHTMAADDEDNPTAGGGESARG